MLFVTLGGGLSGERVTRIHDSHRHSINVLFWLHFLALLLDGLLARISHNCGRVFNISLRPLLEGIYHRLNLVGLLRNDRHQLSFLLALLSSKLELEAGLVLSRGLVDDVCIDM